MVNLIPPRAKKGVIVEYWIRVLTIWAVICTMMIILLGLTLAPVHVLVQENTAIYEDSAADATKKIASLASVSDELDVATAQAQLLLTNSKTISLSKIVTLVNSLENNGIVLGGFTLARADGNAIAPVVLTGTARDRQALADFRDRLLAEEQIETVDFPIENLARDRDIEFTITVTMSSNNLTS